MKILPALLAASAVFFPFNAYAKEKNAVHDHEGWEISAGAGVLYAPTYLGDDDYQLSVLPNIRVTYEDKFFASVQEGVGYNVINTENWRVGPIVRYDFGRDEDGENTFSISGDDTNDLRGLGDVDGTVELGAFFEYEFKPFVANLEIRQGVGGHEGLLGEAGLDYKGRTQVGQKAVIYSFGPNIVFADSNYHEEYFGVNARQSAASGLAQYDPDAGVLTYGLGGSVIVPVTDKVSTVFLANYNRLGEESADSSLVERRGSENQGTIGMFVNYRF